MTTKNNGQIYETPEMNIVGIAETGVICTSLNQSSNNNENFDMKGEKTYEW